MHLDPPVQGIFYIHKQYMVPLHFPRKQVGSGLGKPWFSSLSCNGCGVFLCLASGYYNTAITVMFQIKTI